MTSTSTRLHRSQLAVRRLGLAVLIETAIGMANLEVIARLGYEGKWAIRPAQIELANEVFTPDPQLVRKTHRIIAAMKDAAAQGNGAVSLDGRLIDAASIRMAPTLLAKLEQIKVRGAHPAALSTNAPTSEESSSARVMAASSATGAPATGR